MVANYQILPTAVLHGIKTVFNLIFDCTLLYCNDKCKALEQVLTLSVHNYNYYSLRTHKMEFAKCVFMGSCDILALYFRLTG